MLHIVAGICDIQSRLNEDRTESGCEMVEDEVRNGHEHASLECNGDAAQSTAEESINEDKESDPEITDSLRDVEETVPAEGKTFSCEVDSCTLPSSANMASVPGMSEVSCRPQEEKTVTRSLENSSVEVKNEAVSEIHSAKLSPIFQACNRSNADSVMTDSGISEQTSTESDYSDSLEEDEEPPQMPDISQETEPKRSDIGPNGESLDVFEEMVPFSKPKNADLSWYDFQSNDFFIDFKLNNDDAPFVEFDPFNSGCDLRTLGSQGSEENSPLDTYNPIDHDLYAPCKAFKFTPQSSPERDSRKSVPTRNNQVPRQTVKRLANFSAPWIDEDEGEMLVTSDGGQESGARRCAKVIDYDFVMHDETWGYSSHEHFFDVITGQRILSTIYEFEVSEEEDTESVMTEPVPKPEELRAEHYTSESSVREKEIVSEDGALGKDCTADCSEAASVKEAPLGDSGDSLVPEPHKVSHSTKEFIPDVNSDFSSGSLGYTNEGHSDLAHNTVDTDGNTATMENIIREDSVSNMDDCMKSEDSYSHTTRRVHFCELVAIDDPQNADSVNMGSDLGDEKESNQKYQPLLLVDVKVNPLTRATPESSPAPGSDGECSNITPDAENDSWKLETDIPVVLDINDDNTESVMDTPKFDPKSSSPQNSEVHSLSESLITFAKEQIVCAEGETGPPPPPPDTMQSKTVNQDTSTDINFDNSEGKETLIEENVIGMPNMPVEDTGVEGSGENVRKMPGVSAEHPAVEDLREGVRKMTELLTGNPPVEELEEDEKKIPEMSIENPSVKDVKESERRMPDLLTENPVVEDVQPPALDAYWDHFAEDEVEIGEKGVDDQDDPALKKISRLDEPESSKASIGEDFSFRCNQSMSGISLEISASLGCQNSEDNAQEFPRSTAEEERIVEAPASVAKSLSHYTEIMVDEGGKCFESEVMPACDFDSEATKRSSTPDNPAIGFDRVNELAQINKITNNVEDEWAANKLTKLHEINDIANVDSDENNRAGSITNITDTSSCEQDEVVKSGSVNQPQNNNKTDDPDKSVGDGSGSGGVGGGVSQLPSLDNKPTNLTSLNHSSPQDTLSGENNIYQPGFDSKLESEGTFPEEDVDSPRFSPSSLVAKITISGEDEIYQLGFDSKLESEGTLVEEIIDTPLVSPKTEANRETSHDDKEISGANFSEDCFDLDSKLYFQIPTITISNINHPVKEETKNETKLMNEAVVQGEPQKVESDKPFTDSTDSCSPPSQPLQSAPPNLPPSRPERRRMYRHSSRPQRKSLPEDHTPRPSELRRTKTDVKLVTDRPVRPVRRKTLPGKRSKSKENMADTVEPTEGQTTEKDSGSERSFSMASAYSEDERDCKDKEGMDLELSPKLATHDHLVKDIVRKDGEEKEEGRDTEIKRDNEDVEESPNIIPPYHLQENEALRNDLKTEENVLKSCEDKKSSKDTDIKDNDIYEDLSQLMPHDHLEEYPALNDESPIISENVLTEGCEPEERPGSGGEVLEVRESTYTPRTPEVGDALTFAEEGVLGNACDTVDTPLIIVSRCQDVKNNEPESYPAIGAGNENGKEDVTGNKEHEVHLILETGFDNGKEDVTNLELVQRCIDRLESSLTQQIAPTTNIISANSVLNNNSDTANVSSVIDDLDSNYQLPAQRQHTSTPHSYPQSLENTPCTDINNPLPPRRKKKTPPINETLFRDKTFTSHNILEIRYSEEQASFVPVAPVRKKKQFYSLPRKPKQPTPTPPSRRPVRRTASAASSHPEKVRVIRHEESSIEIRPAQLEVSCLEKSTNQSYPAEVDVSCAEKSSTEICSTQVDVSHLENLSSAQLKVPCPEEISTPLTSRPAQLKESLPVQLFTSQHDDKFSYRDEDEEQRKSSHGGIAMEDDKETITSLNGRGTAKEEAKEQMKSLKGGIANEVLEDSEQNPNVLLVRHVRTHSDGENEELEVKKPPLKRTGSLRERMYYTLHYNFARNPLQKSDGGKLRLSKFFTLKHRSYDIQNSELAFADKNDSRESYHTSGSRSPGLFRSCLKGSDENGEIKTSTTEEKKPSRTTETEKPHTPVRQHKKSMHPKPGSSGDLSPQLNRTEIEAEPTQTDARQPPTLTEITPDNDPSKLSDPTRRPNTTNDSSENEKYEDGENKRDAVDESEWEKGECERNDRSKPERSEADENEESVDVENKEGTLVPEEAETKSPSTRLEGDEPTSPSDCLEDEVFWERPSVPLRTWAERQGTPGLELPPLCLRYEDEEEVVAYGPGRGCPVWLYERDTPSPGPPVDADKDCGRHPNKQQQQQQQQKREDDRTQKDRCVEVYPETVRQRQRNMMAAANKVDIKNWNSSGPNNNNSNHTNNNNNNDTLTSPSKVKKFLPSVKALRNQFETGKANSVSSRLETNGTATTTNGNGNLSQSRKSSTSNSSLASSNVDNKSNSTNSLHSPSASVENLVGSPADSVKPLVDRDEPVEPIYNQFKKVDEELRELMSKPPSTSGWNPRSLLKRLYYIPEAPRMQSQGTTYVNIEGYLEKLPSGRKKATFWNAWKRRYFVAKEGVLYYYQGNQTEKPSMKMTLMGGRVESMDPNMVGVDDGSRDTKASVMLGIDDGKGHYVVVRCSSRQEAERWRRALETHTVEDFASQYVQPWPMPTNPTLLRDTLVIDIGSASIRAGILASQATLPQLFMPSVVANSREGRRQVWGFDALAPEVRSGSSIAFPIRPSQKISKYSVDLSAVSSLLQKTFAELKVDPKNYHIQLSVPRVLNTNTQAELLRVLFDKHGVRSVNLTHQSILALYAYNATSGIVVDVGERMDIVPVIDGYIVDGGVSRVPYGGYRILDHLRQFLYMRNVSLINEVESYIIRHVLENICYSAHHYNTEKARCTANPDSFEKSVSLKEYFSKDCPYESISLDFGRFQATEGLFNPDAWGLDHPGLHKLVHKAIMECSMDIRKEMSRSIFLAGGVSQLPGLVDRLTTEIDNLTPPAIRPKVHASPYRYHAAYIGACVLAESPAFAQSRITKEDWTKYGNAALRKWSL